MSNKRQYGTALFSNIVTQDKLSGKFSITLMLDEEQRADAETQELRIKEGTYQDKPQNTARFNTKYELPPKAVVGRDKAPFVSDQGARKEIPRGSEVLVIYRDRPWEHMGKSGVSYDLVGIQVINEVSSEILFDDLEGDVFGEDSGAEY